MSLRGKFDDLDDAHVRTGWVLAEDISETSPDCQCEKPECVCWHFWCCTCHPDLFWCVGWLYRNANAEIPSLLMLLRLEHMDLILASFYKEAAPVKAQVEK